MKTVDQVIEAMGGPDKAQAACVITAEALKKWRQKRFVPSKHWLTVVNITSGKIRFADLAAMTGEKK